MGIRLLLEFLKSDSTALVETVETVETVESVETVKTAETVETAETVLTKDLKKYQLLTY